MNGSRVAHLLAASLAAFSVSCGHVEGSPDQARGKPMPRVTARAYLTEATAGAKKWRPDAILIQVASSIVDSGGTTTMWDYGFWSASAKGCALIDVVPGQGAFPRESGGPTCQSTELTTFIDSDQALKIARANGITSARVSMVVSNSLSKSGKSPVWAVRDEKPGDLMVDIDGSTGAVLGKTKQ